MSPFLRSCQSEKKESRRSNVLELYMRVLHVTLIFFLLVELITNKNVGTREEKVFLQPLLSKVNTIDQHNCISFMTASYEMFMKRSKCKLFS